MIVSWRFAQTYTEAKYPAARVRVEAMAFADLVESINQAYIDRDFLALQYLGTCLSSSVFGMLRGSSTVGGDLPQTLARLHRDINAACRERDVRALHHLGNRLAAISVLEHVVQTSGAEEIAVDQCDDVMSGVRPQSGRTLEAWHCRAGSLPSSSAAA